MVIKLNKKGSTLIEVLVAITIFAIFSLVISSMFISITKSSRNNIKENKEIADQTEKAEKGDTNNNSAVDDSFTLKFGEGGTEYNIDIKKYTIKEDDDSYNLRIFK